MKKHNNIPFKERKRNADRVYRHEERLEEIGEKRLFKEKIQSLQGYEEAKSDKERECDEVYQRLKALEERSEG